MVLEFIAEFIHVYPLIGIILFSLSISLLITTIIYFMTDKEKMKELKGRQKELQRQAKEHRENGDHEAFLEINKQIMEQMPEILKHSIKPMFVIMIPIFLIFGWANANIAYTPIAPGEEFVNEIIFEKGIVGEVEIIAPEKVNVVDSKIKTIEESECGSIFNYECGKVNWTLKGEEGDYILRYKQGGREFTHEVIITNGIKYTQPYKPPTMFSFGKEKIESVTSIKTKNDKFVYINFFGWKMGWLISYILFSIIFGTILRKVFGLQ